jgi:hypothetical protein
MKAAGAVHHTQLLILIGTASKRAQRIHSLIGDIIPKTPLYN